MNMNASDEDEPLSSTFAPSRLNLAFRRTLKRKFPKKEPASEIEPHTQEPKKHSVKRITEKQATVEADCPESEGVIGPDGFLWPPLLHDQEGRPYFKHSPVFFECVDQNGTKWVNCPSKKKKPEPYVQMTVDDVGVELFELGHGWNVNADCGIFKNRECAALTRSKEALNGTFVSRYAVLDPNKTYEPPSFPDSSLESDVTAAILMLNVVRRQVLISSRHWLLQELRRRKMKNITTISNYVRRAGTSQGKFQNEESVIATIEIISGLQATGFTYLGCSRYVYGGPGQTPWRCRKRVGFGDPCDNEVLNHKNHHDGECCTEAQGIPCFAMLATIQDESGHTNVQLWAPAIHILDMLPSTFLGLNDLGRKKAMQSVRGKPFKMQLMTAWSARSNLHFFKILFVEDAVQMQRPLHAVKIEDTEAEELAETISKLDVAGPSGLQGGTPRKSGRAAAVHVIPLDAVVDALNEFEKAVGLL